MSMSQCCTFRYILVCHNVAHLGLYEYGHNVAQLGLYEYVTMLDI